MFRFIFCFFGWMERRMGADKTGESRTAFCVKKGKVHRTERQQEDNSCIKRRKRFVFGVRTLPDFVVDFPFSSFNFLRQDGKIIFGVLGSVASLALTLTCPPHQLVAATFFYLLFFFSCFEGCSVVSEINSWYYFFLFSFSVRTDPYLCVRACAICCIRIKKKIKELKATWTFKPHRNAI